MKTFNRLYIHTFLFSIVIILLLASCEDFVEIDPPRTEIVPETLFSSDQTAEFVANGMYTLMISINSMYSADLEILSGIASDELVNFSSRDDFVEFSRNEILPDNGSLLNSFWRNSYQIINNANGLIEGLEGNANVTPLVRDQLLGEALFLRAYIQFYLVNLFGSIPYVKTTDIQSNNSIFKNSVEEANIQIIDDLLEAQSLLSGSLANEDEEFRVRPNVWAATSLLARVYLYQEDWENAESEASKVIDAEGFALEAGLNDVFLAASREAIWQLVPLDGERTNLGLRFPITVFGPGNAGGTGATALSDGLLAAFGVGDNRSNHWVGSRGSESFPIKYKNSISLSIGRTDIPEYVVMLRLAEQYLIRAEARARRNDLSGAAQDLDTIRNRAGLTNITVTDQDDILEAIMQERRIEFFAEGGHRWLDLKRTGRADEILSSLKESWQPTDALWPIPESEILNNPNLLPQNPGY